MNIGFDLDKVFIDYPPFIPSALIDKLYKKKDNGELIYRIPNYPEQVFRKATHTPFLRAPIKNNLTFLKSISKKENKLYLISSRFKFLEERTWKVVKKYHLDAIFDGLFFNFENKQPHIFKNKVISKLNLDIYIDDDLSLIKYVAKHNPKTKFFWLTQEKNSGGLPSNIYAIHTLPKINNELKIRKLPMITLSQKNNPSVQKARSFPGFMKIGLKTLRPATFGVGLRKSK